MVTLDLLKQKMNAPLTHQELLRWLCYIPSTGEWFWIEHPIYGFKFFGRRTARRTGGQYQSIMILRKVYKAHRMAFFYMTGRWPANVDHKNKRKTENQWGNLREATKQQNAGNTHLNRNNTSGLKGVSGPTYGKWNAFISTEGKSKYLGRSACPAAAHFLYLIAAHEQFGEFA